MIEIFPSKLQGAALETHHTAARMSLEQWLSANVASFERRAVPPISIHLNGALVDDWSVEFGPDDLVAIYPEPKAEVAWTTIAITAAVSVAVSMALTILLTPKAQKPSSGALSGDKLNEAAAKGNKAKINAPIREVAGRRRIYPDYLLPMHRYFASPREQWVEMLLCIGKGEYEIEPAYVMIGDTPIGALGDDVEYAIYGPGADLSADSRAQWWHSASEVGATSTGSAGLDLRGSADIEQGTAAQAYSFSGYTVSIPTGAGSFPSSWAAGMVVRIESPTAWTVIDGGGSRDIIEGDFSELEPFAGMQIEIVGDNGGLYTIASYTPPVFPATVGQITLDYVGGGAVTALATGTVQMGIGYAGLRYLLSAASTSSLTVVRLTDDGLEDSGWGGFATLQSNEAVITFDSSTTAGDWAGPFAACPPGEVTDSVEVDVMFPGGLIGIDKKGRRLNHSVKVQIEWRDMAAAGAWNTITLVYTERTLDQIGFTETISLPSMMRPEVRMRRVGADSEAANVQDTVQWYGLRAKLSPPASYSGVTLMALRVRGGKRLSAQSEQLVSVTATRKLPTRSGGSWTAPVATRDIAPWFAYLAKSVGYTDDDIDLAELDRLHAIWSARGDTFDQSVERESTVKQSFADALLAGFADVTLDRGVLRPVRDELRTTWEHMYTPQNMTEGLSRRFTAVQPDEFDGVDVEYMDGGTWQVETVQCRLPGDLGRRVEKLKIEGVTSRTQAWRIGMRQRRATKFRRWQYSFSTELDALNSRFMSFCALADDVPGYGQSAILMDVQTVTGGYLLESSEPLDWSAGGAHVVSIRRKDGTLSGPYSATRIDDYRLQVATLDFVPDTSWSVEPPHLLFGPVNRWSYPALISSIRSNGSGADVEAMNYDARVYADDDNAPA